MQEVLEETVQQLLAFKPKPGVSAKCNFCRWSKSCRNQHYLIYFYTMLSCSCTYLRPCQCVNKLAHSGLTHQDATDIVLSAITAPGMAWACACHRRQLCTQQPLQVQHPYTSKSALMQDPIQWCPVLSKGSSCC